MRQFFILALLPTLLAGGCRLYDNRLVVVNQTNHSIAVSQYMDSIPDLTRTSHKVRQLQDQLPPNQSGSMMQHGMNWPSYVKNSRDGKLHLVVFALDSLKKYDTIEDLIVHRAYRVYRFDKKYLVDNKWMVVLK